MIRQPSPQPIHVEPKTKGGVATAEQGLVMLDGPAGVAVAMTPEAAAETGYSLLAAAEEAGRQRGGSRRS
ncbi:hypothetical protein [Sphingomonas sp. M1-B02]|uniref:hypothetical protein n=1 Tax=Sphingomonas sp. M1-B02 TaxID=3114300 RepID=UPI00223E9243|nr:hypothetical protein [Sphingomonas sp. S6-11]UZK67889.1 hypothetical protein OKW87_03480 [Sphingomonas sp. S6-11]